MTPFRFIDKPNLLEKRPAWMSQAPQTTTTVTTTSPAAAALPNRSGADMITVVILGGLVLTGLELGGVTHVFPWFKKTLGLSKKK